MSRISDKIYINGDSKIKDRPVLRTNVSVPRQVYKPKDNIFDKKLPDFANKNF